MLPSVHVIYCSTDICQRPLSLTIKGKLLLTLLFSMYVSTLLLPRSKLRRNTLTRNSTATNFSPSAMHSSHAVRLLTMNQMKRSTMQSPGWFLLYMYVTHAPRLGCRKLTSLLQDYARGLTNRNIISRLATIRSITAENALDDAETAWGRVAATSP